MKTFLFFLLFLIVGCSSKNKAVNEPPTPPLLPMAPLYSPGVAQDAISRAPTSAIQGNLVLKGDIPTPLIHVQLGLYKKQNDAWTEITRFNSETDGHFSVTQKLTRGHYELRVLDPRYSAVLPVTLEKDPVRGLIVEAEKKK